MADHDVDRVGGPAPHELDLRRVTSRRDLLKGAAALGLVTAGLPSLRRVGAFPAQPRHDTGTGGGPGLWNGQPVTEPIGLSFEGTPKRGGHITWAWIYEPVPQMDPQLPTTGDTGDLQALYSLYDRLTNIIPGTLTNGPGLAESWEIAKGGLEYTFYLRHAEFSNGDTITANDVKFSLERFANPAINSQYAWLNAIDTVQALNARTVRVTLQYVQAMFLDVVGHATTGIVPQRVVEKMGKEFGKNPVGSGAFIFESKTAGESISFKRNPNFWNSPKPYIDGYTLNYVPDDNARMLQVTSGIASAGYPVPYALLDQYRDVKGTRLQLEPYTNIMFIAPNLKVPPFNEQNVRLALNYATPLETINKVVFKNAAQIANSAIGKLQYWDPEIPYIPYDLDKAKAYLAKSSVPHGFTTSLLIVGTDTDSVELATILQSSWGQIGINLKIDEVDIVTLEDRFFSITNPNYDLCFFGADLWASVVGAPDEIGELMYYSKKYDFGGLFYNDPHATALVNQATHTINETVRKRDWGELQRYCLSVNPPGIPIAFGPNVSLVNSKVQGFQCLCSNFWPLEDVWINS